VQPRNHVTCKSATTTLPFGITISRLPVIQGFKLSIHETNSLDDDEYLNFEYVLGIS
jgi:hypothetical protein